MAETKQMIAEEEIQTAKTSKTINLSEAEKAEMEANFAQAKDFREIWEKITAPLDSVISETAKIIDSDPIMNVSNQLEQMNGEVQTVYKDIMNTDWTIMKVLKTIPGISIIAEAVWNKVDQAKFNMKSMEGKIGIIFSGFDQAYTSINTSIDMQKKFLEGIEQNISKVEAYKAFLDEKIVEFREKASTTTDETEKMKYDMFLRNVEFFTNNLTVLIGNLKMTEKRLLMRLDAGQKLSLAMNSSRPIFKTLLSTAMIETSSQQALDASMKVMQSMWAAIDKMSSDLTDSVIAGSKKAEEMSSKPVLSTQVFVENVTKLKNHFDQIDSFRANIKATAEADKKVFEEAKTKLENIRVLSKESQEELAKELA